jgi:hypothetical protein
MAATVLVAAVISSLLRLWCRWRCGKIAQKKWVKFVRVKSVRVSVSMSLPTIARKEDVPFDKKWMKTAVGIEEPNSHKLRRESRRPARGWTSERGDTLVLVGWFSSSPRSSLSNARHQYFLVTLFSPLVAFFSPSFRYV